MADVDKRHEARVPIWLPLAIRSDGHDLMGVTGDVTERGLLVLTRVPLVSGQKVTLLIVIPGETTTTLEAGGRVIYEGPNLVDPGGLWPQRAGVALDEPFGVLYKHVLALTDAQPAPSSRSGR